VNEGKLTFYFLIKTSILLCFNGRRVMLRRGTSRYNVVDFIANKTADLILAKKDESEVPLFSWTATSNSFQWW